MIDSQHAFASWFLWISAVGFSLAFALPLLFVPLTWARIFQWRVPDETHLTIYFGRCVGALAATIVLFAVRAAVHPDQHRYMFELIAVACGLMTGLHIWGAVRRMQPWTETVEIGLYAAMTGLSYAALRSLG
jgi:hypothetical protein